MMEYQDPEAPDGETALQLLQAIYKNKLAPLSLRMRAASLALPKVIELKALLDHASAFRRPTLRRRHRQGPSHE
jgi:hypothetical protein